MRPFVAQVLLAFALAGTVLGPYVMAADCPRVGPVAVTCANDHKLLQSQQRDTTIVFPNATKALKADGTVTITSTDICSNVANGIPCLDSNTKVDVSVLPTSVVVSSCATSGALLKQSGACSQTTDNGSQVAVGTPTVSGGELSNIAGAQRIEGKGDGSATVRRGLVIGEGTGSIYGQISLSQNITGDYYVGGVYGFHGLEDHNAIDMTGSINAYASLAISPHIVGSSTYDHFKAIQAWPYYSSSGPMTYFYGADVYNSHTGTGVITNNYGLHVWTPAGTGPITNNYGIYLQDQSRGTNNWAIYSAGAAKSYLGGHLGIGTAPDGSARIASIGFLVFTDSQLRVGDAGVIAGGAATAHSQIDYYNGKSLTFSESGTSRLKLDSTGARFYSRVGVGVAPDSTAQFSSIGYLLFTDSQLKLGDAGVIGGGAATAHSKLDYYTGKSLTISESGDLRLTLDNTSAAFARPIKLNGATSGAVTHGVASTTASYSLLDPSTASGAGQAIVYPSGGGQGTWVTPLAGTLTTTRIPVATSTSTSTATSTSTLLADGYLEQFTNDGSVVGDVGTFVQPHTDNLIELGQGSGGFTPHRFLKAHFSSFVEASNIDSGGNTTGHAASDLTASTAIGASGGDYAWAYRTGTNTTTNTATGTSTSCPLNRNCTMVRTSTTTATATITNTINGHAISGNPVLTASDVGALAPNAVTCSGKTKVSATNGQITSCTDATYSDVGADAAGAATSAVNSAISGTTGGLAYFSGAHTLASTVGHTATPTANVVPVSDASGTLNEWVGGRITVQWLDTPSSVVVNPDSAWHALTTDTWTLVGSTIEVDTSAVFSSAYDATYCGLAIYADNGSSATTYWGVQDWAKGPMIPGLSGTLGTAHSHAMITGLSGTVTVSVKAYAVGNNCVALAQTHIKVWK